MGKRRPAPMFGSHVTRGSFLGAAFRLTFLTALFLAVAGTGWVAHFARTTLDLPASARQLIVAQGTSFRGIGRQLVESGALSESVTFELLGRALGKAGAVKAGTYQLPARMTPYALIDKLARGDLAQSEITFIEGWTFRQMRAALDAHPGVKHDTAGLTDVQVLARIKAAEPHPEGLFFPDTYHFNTGASDLQVLGRAYQTMQARLAAAWELRDPNVPYDTPYAALTMASVVEKETGRPEDRRMIAAVFSNRLKRGMRLQTDPSVIYGLGASFDGNLRKRDLETDGPYNTYTRGGLPPTPIAMPGQGSLDATMNPAPSQALYFVSRGDGTSYFSETLQEHNRAVQKYQLNR